MRTTLQKEADEFDRRLYTLAVHAEENAKRFALKGWETAAAELLQMRRHVRGYMHKADREATES